MSNRWYKLIIIEHSVPKPKCWGTLIINPGDKYGWMITRAGKRRLVKLHPDFTCGRAVPADIEAPIGRLEGYFDGDDFERTAIIDNFDYWGYLRSVADDETELQNRARWEIPWYAY